MPDLHAKLFAALAAVQAARARAKVRGEKLAAIRELVETRKRALAEREAEALRERARAELDDKRDKDVNARSGRLQGERAKLQESVALLPVLEEQIRNDDQADLAACRQVVAVVEDDLQLFLNARLADLRARAAPIMLELVHLFGTSEVQQSLKGPGRVAHIFFVPDTHCQVFQGTLEDLRRNSSLDVIAGSLARAQAALPSLLPAVTEPSAPAAERQSL